MDISPTGWIDIALGIFLLYLGAKYFWGKTENSGQSRVDGKVCKDHEATMRGFAKDSDNPKYQKIKAALEEYESLKAAGKNPDEPKFATVEFKANGKQYKEIIKTADERKLGDFVKLTVNLQTLGDAEDVTTIPKKTRLLGVLFIVLACAAFAISPFV